MSTQPLPIDDAEAPDLVVRVADAKARLSELIARAERGERVVIARGDVPVVTLAPVRRQRRVLGALLDIVPDLDLAAVEAAAEDDWTEEELDDFQGDLENELRGDDD